MNVRKIFHARYNSGFSLIEVVIATAVSSLILLMVYSAHKSIMTSIYDLSGVAEFYENVNLAIHRIDADISYCYYSRYNTKVNFIGENDMGAMSNGRVYFVSAQYNESIIEVSPKSPLPQSDIREVAYYLKPDRIKNGLFSLMRREDSHYDDDPEAGGSESMLLENIVDLKFEFRRGNEWADKWDSREDRKFPPAVRTTMKVKNYRGNDEEFVFMSHINPVN
jgi:type II secretion system protein J